MSPEVMCWPSVTVFQGVVACWVVPPTNMALYVHSYGRCVAGCGPWL